MSKINCNPKNINNIKNKANQMRLLKLLKEEKMKKIILKIDGMTCSACSSGLEKYLLKQKGIEDALVNLVMATASITYDDSLTITDLNRYVKEAGFTSLGEYDENNNAKEKNKLPSLIINGLLAFLVLYISMSHMVHLPVIPFLHMLKHPINYSVTLCLFSLYFMFFGRDIIYSGLKNIKYKSPNMDTLVTLGVLSSFIYSTINMFKIINGSTMYVENLYFESVCIIIYLIKLGRYIDNISKEKTKEAIKGLVTITPKTALKLIENEMVEVSLDEIKKGDVLLVKPGMKFAVDGQIVDGQTHVDESFISGESLPVKKTLNSRVVAGSVNIDGTVQYQAEHIGKYSTISEIVRLVVEATNTKAPIAQVADKVSGIFVPTIILIAICTLIGHLLLGHGVSVSLVHFVTVLVCACPCALGLATPLALVVSEGVCAKHGLLVKKSATLENVSKIDTIVFDKTGTLTNGKLSVSKINNYSSYEDQDLLKIVTSLEALSSHPIANAFINEPTNLKELSPAVTAFKNIPGLGISGKINKHEYYVGNSKLLDKLKIKNNYLEDEDDLSKKGNSIVYVIENKQIIALIGVKDNLRDNTKQVIKKLQSLHKEIIMLTGDNEKTAALIAESIGIKQVIANVTPKEKAANLKKLLADGKQIMMVGDGINDAPSLSLASIGVSLNSGTDIAGDSADIILMNNNLQSIYNLFDISKKTLLNIKENLFWAFFYNVCMIPLAIGFFEPLNITMNPMVAGLAMTLSSTTVILNALRLKKWKEDKNV